MLRRDRPVGRLLTRSAGVALVLLAAAREAPAANVKGDTPDAVLVLASFTPLAILTVEVCREVPGVDVESLLPPSAGCPHHYDLRPADLRRLVSARALVTTGTGLESFLPARRLARFRGLRVIEAAAGCRFIRYDDAGHPEPLADPRHEHERRGAINPHVWLSPREAATMARNIAAALAGVLPEQRDRLLANAEAFGARLEHLADDWASRAASWPNRRIVLLHDNFTYLARDLGLEVVAVIEHVPRAGHSLRARVELQRTIREAAPAAIVAETPGSDIVATLAAETGLPVVRLDDMTRTPPPILPGTYERLMTANCEALQDVLAR